VNLASANKIIQKKKNRIFIDAISDKDICTYVMSISEIEKSKYTSRSSHGIHTYFVSGTKPIQAVSERALEEEFFEIVNGFIKDGYTRLLIALNVIINGKDYPDLRMTVYKQNNRKDLPSLIAICHSSKKTAKEIGFGIRPSIKI